MRRPWLPGGALLVALALCAPALAARAQDVYDALDGFDDAPEDDVDAFDPLEGFEDAPLVEPTPDTASWRDLLTGDGWELSGSLSLGSSYNYLHHDSSTGTNYYGLSRLRSRLNLELDVELPCDWEGRVAGYGWYDSAYQIQGRNYTHEVIDDYEWDADFLEVWVRGAVSDDVDLKIGRQIVNWGRSDSLRVLDVLNPLDNLEPGIVDIESLRRPVTMVKADAYLGDWSLSLVAIPEIRFSRLPPIGSDFAGFDTFGGLEFFEAPRKTPSESFDHTGWAARLSGIFSGWDVSLQFARIWLDAFHVDGRFNPGALAGPNPLAAFAGTQLEHSRVTLVGGGANYTIGSFLFKSEIAWIDGVEYATSQTFVFPAPISMSADIPIGTKRRDRLDFMFGVEYYGFVDTTIAVEVVNRHIFGYSKTFRPSFGVQRNALETAIRVTRTFLNERLDATVLALIFGNHAQDGSVVRVDAYYDLRDALTLGGGILLYNSGKIPPFDTISRNDRLFLEIKYSF